MSDEQMFVIKVTYDTTTQTASLEGDIVNDIVPVRVGTARTLFLLDSQGGTVVFGEVVWPLGRPSFIKEEVTAEQITLEDDNFSFGQRGSFPFTLTFVSPIDKTLFAGSIDPTIINTDIPLGATGVTALGKQIRRVA